MSTKQSILTVLEQRRGEPISGEALAQTLSVSRAAVWKAISALQMAGHAIDAEHGKGYTLHAQSDVLSVEGISAHLPYSAPVLVAETLPSTNLTAKELAASGAPHGTLVVANAQTAGRGRRGRSFASPPGTGLYLSLVLRSALPMESAALITSAAAVGVCRALAQVCGKTDVQIKWVNDLYTQGKKCCGILAEAATNLETGDLDYIVVGIGLNLHLPSTGFPPEVAEIATALFAANEFVPRCHLAAAIATAVTVLCDTLPSVDFMEEYRARNLVPGRDILILQNGDTRPAHALSITDEGRLRVRLPDGSTETLSFGEVSIQL